MSPQGFEAEPEEEVERAAALAAPGPGQTVASTAATALSGQVAVYALSFITSIIVTRALEATGRGQYYVPIIAATACVAVVNIGLESANTVFAARRRHTLAQLSRNASMLALIVGPLAVGAMVLLFAALESSAFRSISIEHYLIGVGTVPFALHLLWMANIFLLARQLARSQIALLAGAIVYLTGAVVLALMDKLGITEALLLYGASVFVPWLLHVRWSRFAAPVRPSFDPDLAKTVVGFGLRFHVGLIFSYLLLRSDVFFVNSYLGAAEVGIYSLAVLFAELAWLLTGPLVQATIPFQAEASHAASASLAFKAARFNFVLSISVSALFAATLWFVLPALYGEEFSAAYVPLLLLMPGIAAMAAARSLGLLLAREGRPLLYGVITFAAFAANCALNVVLLPKLGLAGASVASSVAYTGLTIALVLWGLRVGRLSPRVALLPQPGDWASVSKALGAACRRIRPRHQSA